MFTPVETSVGAFLLHQATSVQLFQNGTVLGASGLMRKVLFAPTRGTLAFFAGMALSILPLKWFIPELATQYPPVPSTFQAALVTLGIGALVGWGTKVYTLESLRERTLLTIAGLRWLHFWTHALRAFKT